MLFTVTSPLVLLFPSIRLRIQLKLSTSNGHTYRRPHPESQIFPDVTESQLVNPPEWLRTENVLPLSFQGCDCLARGFSDCCSAPEAETHDCPSIFHEVAPEMKLRLIYQRVKRRFRRLPAFFAGVMTERKDVGRHMYQ